MALMRNLWSLTRQALGKRVLLVFILAPLLGAFEVSLVFLLSALLAVISGKELTGLLDNIKLSSILTPEMIAAIDDNIYLLALTVSSCVLFLRLLQMYLSQEFGLTLGVFLRQRLMVESFATQRNMKHTFKQVGLASAIHHDTNVVADLLNVMSNAFSGLVVLVIVVSSLTLANPTLTGFVLTFLGLVYLGILSFTVSRAKSAGTELSEIQRNYHESVTGIIRNFREIYIFNNLFHYLGRLTTLDNLAKFARLRIAMYGQSPRQFVEYAVTLFIIGIALLDGYAQLPDNTLAALVVFALAAQRLMPIAQQLYNSLATYSSAKTSLERIVASLQERARTTTSINPASTCMVVSMVITERDSSLKMPSNPVKTNQGMRIRLGEPCVIRGRTGRGKTSLLDTISGLEDTNHWNVAYFDAEQNLIGPPPRSDVGYVQQSPELIGGSVYENIVLDRVGYPRSLLERELGYLLGKSVDGAREFLGRLVDSNGHGVSGGERKVIGMMRVVIREPRVMLLDEVTAGMDSQLQCRFIEWLLSKCGNLLMIIVTHEDIPQLKSYKTIDI